MTYKEWLKKYLTEFEDCELDNLFEAFGRWLEENPAIKKQVLEKFGIEGYGVDDIFNILYANKVIEKEK